jgi:hypothetical protein
MMQTKLIYCLLWISIVDGFFVRRTFTAGTSCLFSEPQENQSIGDVVQGLHGGKYQFSDAGINFEGQQFAEMSYSSGGVQEENYDDEPIPNWALERRAQSESPPEGCPGLSIGPSGNTAVEISNDERSWEKYYGFVIGAASSSYSIEPRVGMLAPRGGANNFSDSATIKISGNVNAGVDTWILLCTEAETWVYRLW